MHRRVRIAIGVLLAGIVSAAGCTVPSHWPDGSVPQVSPAGLQGMIEEATTGGPAVWAADLIGRQLVRFDPSTGVVDERYGGLCDTDDVVVAPDGSLVATCPDAGLVIRVPRGGSMHVLANPGQGVNPIVLDPSGDSVLVGFGTDQDDRLLRVALDGSGVEVVADGLPPLNGFGFGPDGLLYVPTGGAATLLTGAGGLATIDISTGVFTPIALDFADPSRKGFHFAVGVDVAADGTAFVAQATPAEVHAVDVGTGTATLVGTSPLAIVDNVLTLADGRILASGFLGADVAVFTPDGSGGWSRSLRHVGS